MTTDKDKLNITVQFPLPDGRTLVQGPLTYNSDGLATRHNTEFQSNPRFARAYEAGLRTIEARRPSLNIRWRTHVCCWAAEHGLRLEGDFIEFGVFTGLYSRAITEYLGWEQFPDRTFWLLDTFEGIETSLLTEAERQRGIQKMNRKYQGDVYPEVVATFSRYPNVEIVKGAVPATLDQVRLERAAYVSIDMNAVVPEIAAAEFIWDKMVPGALMVLDDYGFLPHIEQKRAFDQFAREKGVGILSMPTGQGLIIKA